jgi:glycosyltransferase involved in cell wall biosynthesis
VQVSIALAVRNGERHVEALLDSLARQTAPPFELVVTDDASEDQTPWILQAFANEAPFPVRIERFEERRGHVEAFMAAARRCQGDLVALCDADDLWREYKLATCLRELAGGTATMAMHSVRIVDEELRDSGREWPKIKHGELVPPLGLAGLEVHAPGMAMIVRRDVLDAADFATRPPSRYGNGRQMLHDEWIFFLAGALGPIQLIAEPLVLYRQHPGNDSGGWVDAKRRRTLRPALGDYRRAAEHTAACAEYLQRTYVANPMAGGRLQAAAAEYRRMSRTWELREELYGARRLQRFGLLRRLFAAGAYAPRREGGMGRGALWKDSTAGVALGLRKPRPEAG